jgi:hypothetical protein
MVDIAIRKNNLARMTCGIVLDARSTSRQLRNSTFGKLPISL